MLRAIAGIVVSMMLTFQLAGCFPLLVGAAVGAGGTIWVTGKLQQNLSASMDKAHNAVLAGLKKLELPVLTDRKDKTTSKIESEYADGKHVWIDLHYMTKATTKIEIRVGTLGDEVRSHEILDNIMKNL